MSLAEMAHGQVSSCVTYLHHRTVITVEMQTVIQYGHIIVSNGTAATDKGAYDLR